MLPGKVLPRLSAQKERENDVHTRETRRTCEGSAETFFVSRVLVTRARSHVFYQLRCLSRIKIPSRNILSATMAAVLWAYWHSVKFQNSLYRVTHELLYLMFNTYFRFFFTFLCCIIVSCRLTMAACESEIFSSFHQPLSSCQTNLYSEARFSLFLSVSWLILCHSNKEDRKSVV